MKYRKIRKAILAAVLAVPMAMSWNNGTGRACYAGRECIRGNRS